MREAPKNIASDRMVVIKPSTTDLLPPWFFRYISFSDEYMIYGRRLCVSMLLGGPRLACARLASPLEWTSVWDVARNRIYHRRGHGWDCVEFGKAEGSRWIAWGRRSRTERHIYLRRWRFSMGIPVTP